MPIPSTPSILARLDWEPVPFSGDTTSRLPYVTHRGMLTIGDFTLECLQLSNGERVFTKETLDKFFGWGKDKP